MIERKDILPLSYLKKSSYTGSYQGMRYRLMKVTEEEETLLQAVCWPQPYNFETTPEKEKEYATFSFSEEGIQKAIVWLNERYPLQSYNV